MMPAKIKLGISTCLLGEKVRYDGQHKLDHFLKDTLGQFIEWVPVCPEVECGLPVPREAMRLVGKPDAPRLLTIKTGLDHTDRMLKWAKNKLDQLDKEELCGFVFKSKSPSSGMKNVKVYSEKGIPRKIGTGIFANEFMKKYPLLPVEEDGRLHDPGLRENFIEKVFVFYRWQSLIGKHQDKQALINFHTAHKLLIMAHCPSAVKELGGLIAKVGKSNFDVLKDKYFKNLMKVLSLQATIKKNTNVLQHIMGYFKKILTKEEKAELLDIIDHYHSDIVPLIVPVTILNHYVRKYQQSYLKTQYYLNPHPLELKLRTHL